MSTLTLVAKTRQGENRINTVRRNTSKWDGRWNILDTQDQVAFAKGRRGPWYRIQPTADERGVYTRWVHASGDDNFTVNLGEQYGTEA